VTARRRPRDSLQLREARVSRESIDTPECAVPALNLLESSASMRTSARTRFCWLAVNTALVVACAKSGSLESEEDPDDAGSRGGSGFGGSSGSGSGGGGAVSAGGSFGVGGSSGSSGTAGAGTGGTGSGGTGTGGTGPGGAAGSAGKAGTGGSGGSSGSSAGSGGNAGTGGSAGVGGSGGTPGCSADQKSCNGSCQTPNPSIGCGLTGCTPCPPAPANATAVCYEQERRCSFDCNTGYARSSDNTRCVPTTCRVQDCQVTCLPFQWKCCQFTNKCGCGWTGFACFDPP
jgi:hypothetical protein